MCKISIYFHKAQCFASCNFYIWTCRLYNISIRYELKIKSVRLLQVCKGETGRAFICESKHRPLFIECQRKYLRPIFLSNRSRDLPRAAVVCGGGKKRNGRNKNITFRDGAPKSAPETSGPFLVFHWRYSARQIECLFSEK